MILFNVSKNVILISGGPSGKELKPGESFESGDCGLSDVAPVFSDKESLAINNSDKYATKQDAYLAGYDAGLGAKK